MNHLIRDRSARLAWLALVLAASAMLLSASGAQAASKRGAVLVKDIRPGRSGSIQGAFRGGGPGPQLANISGTLYFSADDGRHGHELWRSDGTRKGTRMVKDINPGSAGSLFQTTSLSSGTPFYFAADDGTHGFELWRSDGTEAGTMMVKDLFPGAAFRAGERHLRAHQRRRHPLLSLVLPGPPSQGLCRSDGTEAGTVLVKQIIGLGNLTEIHGILYFGGAGDDPTFKIGLWRSDGTTAGTTNIKEGVVPTETTDVNDTLYLAVADGALTGLWRSDGTEAGTEMVKAVIDPAGPDGRDLPQDLTDVNGTLYFLAASAINFSEDTRELWRSDGTEAGTTEVKQINVQSALGGLGIDPDLTAYKGNVYFTAGGALWRSDGTPRGTTIIKGNCSPRAGARTRCFYDLTATGANGTLYLVGSDKKYGAELWQSNGTRKGTRIVSNIRPGSAGSLPMYLTAVNRTLFFTAKDGRHGRELWKVGPKPCKKAKGKCKKG